MSLRADRRALRKVDRHDFEAVAKQRDEARAEVERLTAGVGRIAWRLHLAIGTSDEDIQCILDHLDNALGFEAPE